MDERKIIIGLIILGICCILAVLIPIFWHGPDSDCDDQICPVPDEYLHQK